MIVTKASLTTLIVTIFVLIYWVVGTRIINVYKVAFIGTLFEILWLPMIISLFVMPIWSLYNLIKNRLLFRSVYFYSFIISLITIIVLIA